MYVVLSFSFSMIYNAKTWSKSAQVCHCNSALISLSYLADSDQSLTLRNAGNIKQYIQNLKVIDNQKKLTQLSRAIERWDATRLPFFSPSCSILENKSDWWNPWSPYVWLIGVNSQKRCQSVLHGLCKAEHWLGKRWRVTMPYQRCSDLTAVTNMRRIWHTTPWAKNFTLVLLALTVIYKKCIPWQCWYWLQFCISYPRCFRTSNVGLDCF